MKKTDYISPETTVTTVEFQLLQFAVSGEGVTSGGQDNSQPGDPGYVDPRSRNQSVWEEEEEEEDF